MLLGVKWAHQFDWDVCREVVDRYCFFKVHFDQKPLKSLVLVFFSDFPAKNLSRAEVMSYFAFTLLNWKVYRKHFVITNQRIFESSLQFMRWSNTNESFFTNLAPTAKRCTGDKADFLKVLAFLQHGLSVNTKLNVISLTSPVISWEAMYNLLPLLNTLSCSNPQTRTPAESPVSVIQRENPVAAFVTQLMLWKLFL